MGPVRDVIDLTLLLGGVRSGKSRAAIALANPARSGGARALFVATAEAHDDEMRDRIHAHRGERGDHWETLEAPLELAVALQNRLSRDGPEPTTVVIDCLTLWVSNVLLTLDENDDAERVLADRTAVLIAAIERHASTANGAKRQWIVVSNEVGLGVVPATALGRRYRDALGRTNQLVAAAAQRVVLMVAGLSLDLKTRPQRN
jgi:adenosylcobinamide kinase/adenosylcobinamide-phosphate guanylyltransferase